MIKLLFAFPSHNGSFEIKKEKKQFTTSKR